MQSTASKIRSFVMNMHHKVIFTSADLLAFGSRNAVDIELCRLVKRGLIKRLANGVFSLSLEEPEESPSASEIARIKAERFGKHVIVADNKQISNTGNLYLTINGCKSSFESVHGRIHFRPISPAKLTNPAIPAFHTAEPIDTAFQQSNKILSLVYKLVLLAIHLSKESRAELGIEAPF